MPVKIHPTAVIHPKAELDENVEIGPYSIIGEDVRIGASTFVGPHCVIEYARIGKNNHFTASAFIGTAPQDFKYNGVFFKKNCCPPVTDWVALLNEPPTDTPVFN